ncbi:MAG TPA: sigma 54-interacting transcriptional regulator, partial [Prolixibacteraceae bacterium]|nr:sigma 54-interacting transcriptional regulator [Prolixibacteraceae bacterium]
EIGELPLSTQVRLLRVLESGEFIKVGSSKVIKTNVRVIAATNVDIPNAINEGKFREDLYYRLNTVPINILPLRQRPEDVFLLFRKFSRDFAEKYRMPPVRLDEQAQELLMNYRWPGNVRQLKNITEQISIIEQNRDINAEVLQDYLPDSSAKNLPAIFGKSGENSFSNEREILYKVLFDMKRDMNDLKKLVLDIMEKREAPISGDQARIIQNLYDEQDQDYIHDKQSSKPIHIPKIDKENIQDTEEFVEESLSLEDKEIELIKKALDKHKGKRKYAAQELGISERTLYRKIKEYDIKG